jgi:maleate isomerase
MYGWRGRIGLVNLATDTTVLNEYLRMVPKGVSLHQCPIVLPNASVSREAILSAVSSTQLDEAAARLSWGELSVITLACTLGSLLQGLGWDRTIIDRLSKAAGVPATTTTTAVLDGLRALGVSRIALATPYPRDLTEYEAQFLESVGYKVVDYGCLELHDDRKIARLEPRDAYALVRGLNWKEADCVFISCTAFHCSDVIQAIEDDLGIPVITSNQANAWHCCRLMGIREAASGFGKLWRLQLP